MSILGILWEAAKKLVGARTIYEVIVLLAVLLFYEGIPGIAWVGNKVPVVGAYFYLIEGRVPRAYYSGVNDERVKWEAARLEWEDKKREEINQVSRDYATAMMNLRADNTKLQEILDATQKDEDNAQKSDAKGTPSGNRACPAAVPPRLSDYLNTIR